ncbi:MAG: pyrC [Rickettsiaceae bacterium]|jgi:dihydroorotase|nr:pyrC [Rickettsiaceae bacterium]
MMSLQNHQEQLSGNNFIKVTMPNFSLPYKQSINPAKKIAYINARIIDPETKFDKVGQLLTIGDKIADFGENIFGGKVPEDVEVIDCKGHVLCPGLIDIQVHFREPGQTHKEDLASGSKSAVAGGITTVVCQPNTSPVLDSVMTLEYLSLKAKETAYCNIRAYAAITRGMKGEEISDMHSLKEAGAVGFTDDGLPVMNANVMRRAMEYAKNLNVPVAQHAEDLNLTNKGCINEGSVALELGVRGIPNISESVIVERDLAILEAVGGHYHLLHCSTRESLDAIRRAKAKGLKATVEASPHHFTLTDEAVLRFGTNAKMNPPLRSEQDRLALIEGLKDGTIDAIATDHAPHDINSKNKPLEEASFGIVGVETMLPLSLALYHDGTMPLIDLLATMTYKAADIIHFDGGRLKKAARADLVLIDLDTKWEIDPQKFYSKSKNSPFVHYKTKGRAIRTIVGGVSVYQA